jgi:thiol-disulfide isomerase/thioredoxin
MKLTAFIISTLPNRYYSRPREPSADQKTEIENTNPEILLQDLFTIEDMNTDSPTQLTTQTEMFTKTEVPSEQLFQNSQNLKILNSHNFEKYVINGQESWLIMFYLPYCSRSKKLAPKFQEAADLLSAQGSNLGIKFGVVDAWTEFMLPYDYNIELGERYPSVKFFSSHDKNVVRDYPDKLHSYYTKSEDFRRVALDFFDSDEEIKNGESESDSETGSSDNLTRSEVGVNGPVGIIETFGMAGPVGKFKNHEKRDVGESKSENQDFDEVLYDATEEPEFIFY